MSEQQGNKPHRGGPQKNTAKKKLHQNGQNKKAFAVNAPRKMERMARRSHDVNEKRLHVPMVDRTPDDDPPPVIVAVVGPPGTGKTTLVKSLVRRLTKHTLTEIKGPITVVSGKRRRLTFIEVNNDLNSMVDAAKIADLVLLLIDGNFGLEMETMEFLNIAQHHGMPRVLGVVTHLDLFKSQSTLRTSKKRLKHRFWTEVYQGAKLFYLSGVINGRYPDREILNLGRFISVMKFRPLKWRNEHPYMLADRVTDLTHPEVIENNPKCDRKVAIYGYIHGTPLPSSNAHIHLAGVGDYHVHSVEKLPDPCPTPYFEQKLEEIEREKAKEASANGESVARTTRRRKRLEDKQKIIYAPMSDVGGVFVDKDAVFIDLGAKESFVEGDELGEGEKIVTELQDIKKTMAESFEQAPGLQLFSGSKMLKEDEKAITNSDEESLLESQDDKQSLSDSNNTGRKTLRIRAKGRPVFQNEDLEDYDLDVSSDSDKESLVSKKIEKEFGQRYTADDLDFQADSSLSSDESDGDFNAIASKLNGSIQKKWNINKLVYMKNIDPAEVVKRWRNETQSDELDIEEDEDFFKVKELTGLEEDDDFHSSYPPLEELKERFDASKLDESEEEYDNGYNSIKSRFLIAPKLNGPSDSKLDLDGENGDMYGDFEDLEDNEVDARETNTNDSRDTFSTFDQESENDKGEDSSEDGDEDDEDEDEDDSMTAEEKRKLNAAKKAQLKMQFDEEEDRDFGADDPEGDTEADTWYEFQKNKMAKQLEVNKAEFASMDEASRIQIEGYRAGSYVKLVFNDIPYEFIKNFLPEYPIVLGGLLPTESRFGIMNVRMRRHRWHKKILKSQDPLILSLGWRRFQTLPIYTTSDSRTRNRMLKYTPEHAYCFASFYGPLVAPNTTFVGFNIVDNLQTTGSFRIAATGIVEDLNSSVEIVKKLKLVGHPYKIFRNTAFIKDMFSNSLEVAKFEGASVRTVSGVRGEIKRALSKPEGHFRATFEDKILMSDIIFLKTWYPVKVKKFYNPVTSLLSGSPSEWKGMRLTGAVRAQNGMEASYDPNSAYTKIERSERKFNPLFVPKSVRETLPYKSQIHQMKPQKKKTYMAKRAVVLGGEEKKARDLMQKVATLKNEKETKRKEKKNEKFKEKLKAMAKKDLLRKEKEKERKKDYFLRQGKKRSLAPSDNSDRAFGSKRRS
ncbi:uncharacterized protein PRCAT00000303001 [Priceomyces carsonii]|uniref:uncharacterized protein n=1 Tax=Priceomyces carsonii TaxID=28549 RepID=UPI002ED857DF|nr:unnamed protein product [Priceomyces carsonii]